LPDGASGLPHGAYGLPHGASGLSHGATELPVRVPPITASSTRRPAPGWKPP